MKNQFIGLVLLQGIQLTITSNNLVSLSAASGVGDAVADENEFRPEDSARVIGEAEDLLACTLLPWLMAEPEDMMEETASLLPSADDEWAME